MAFDIEALKEYIELSKQLNMAHQKIGDKVVVDWKTGDPEGDRITLLAAYRDFIRNLKQHIDLNVLEGDELHKEYLEIFEDWNIDTENQIDDVPRIWIKRPGS